MATYIYETVPPRAGAKPVRFEVQQSMQDKPLAAHPETGVPVRRIIAGGYGIFTQKAAPPTAPCGSQCGCVGQY
jgi:predicted nucleic acid-binding Zn ribbon protein